MQVCQVSRKQRMESIWWTILWLSRSHIAPHNDRTRAYCLDQDFPISLLVGMGPSGDNESKAETQDLRADESCIPYIFLPSLKYSSSLAKSCFQISTCHQWLILSIYLSAYPSPTIQLLSQPSATLVWPVGSSPFNDHRTTQESPVAESCDIK